MGEQPQPGPRIIEAFQGYSPSFNAVRLIRAMVREVPPKFLRGLHAIVLTNVAALSRQEREQKVRGRSRRTAIGEALGYYSQARKGEPAQITILVDNIEKQWLGWWWHLGFIRTLALSETFFHELGHHIHRIHRPEYEGRENVADRWSRKLSGTFLGSRYWYMLPVAAPIALLYGLGKDFATLYRKIRARWRKN